MVLVGIFLIVLAGAFILQALGIGGEQLFDFVWPVLVILIGVGFIQEAKRRERCSVCEHEEHVTNDTQKGGTEKTNKTN